MGNIQTEVLQDRVLSFLLHTEAIPVQRHSIHQPLRPQKIKFFIKCFFIKIVSANVHMLYLRKANLCLCQSLQAIRKGIVIIMEIERKYLIKKLPEDLDNYCYKKIEQGYLCNNPTVRIRKMDDEYILTYKSKVKTAGKQKADKAIINNEVELPLTKKAYKQLREKTDSNLIRKKRYYIPLKEGLTAELDIFEGRLKGFYMAEVEFPDEETADSFNPPAWFDRELSADKRFSNHNLSKLSGIDELVL